MSQNFKTTDVLRLEVEDDPTGLVNLIANPSGDLGGWGWVTPVAGSRIEAGGAFYGDVLYYSTPPTGTVPNWFTSEAFPVTAGDYVAAAWKSPSYPSDAETGFIDQSIEFLDGDGAVIASTTKVFSSSHSAEQRNMGPALIPAGTVRARFRIDLYQNAAKGNPDSGKGAILYEVTVATAATSGELGTTRTNLIANSSFDTNLTGWTIIGSAARATNSPQAGTGYMKVTGNVLLGAQVSFTITGGRDYTMSSYLRSPDATQKMTVEWRDGGGKSLGGTQQTFTGTAASTWNRVSLTATAPTPAVTGTLSIVAAEVYYTNHTLDIDSVLVEEGTEVQPFIVGTVGTADLSSIEPTPYLNILGPSNDISFRREAMNLGTLSAVVRDASLDPSQSALIRPGRKVRLRILSGDLWEPLFTGILSEADVTYDLKDPAIPEQKRAKITLTAVDATAALTNNTRSEGVGTLEELPYVLEGCGVPWNIDGLGYQVGSATVVAVNENASALDQVAITRDSVHAAAWLDRYGTLQVWHPDLIDPSVAALLDESQYTDLDLSYSTQDCINEVTVTFLRFNPITRETQEIVYGPYMDQESIKVWGARSADFTIQGLVESASNIEAFANEVLAANATPRLRVNSLKLAITSTADLTAAKALLDLYSLVTISNTAKGINENSRVTGIEHSITPSKWLVTLTFANEGSVAAPTFTPSVPKGASANGSGAAPVPVGGLQMFAGTTPPLGWLVCDGSSVTKAAYPYLFAVIGYTFGGSGTSFNIPDMRRRFPAGAGTGVDLGRTQAGAETSRNPGHNHSAAGLSTGSVQGSFNEPDDTASGTQRTRLRIATFAAHTHNVTGSTGSTSWDDFPSVALNFIIKV